MKFLISSEVAEEIDEIIKIIDEKFDKSEKIVYINKDIDVTVDEQQVSFVRQKLIFKNNLLSKLSDLVFFAYIIIKYKPDSIFSGFSMLKHRLFSSLFRIRHYAYFRGLLFEPSVIGGICDKLRNGKFKLLFKSKIFMTYSADRCYVNSWVTENFLITRGISPDKLSFVKAYWLDSISITHNSSAPGKWIFLTRAHDSHGEHAAHLCQIELIKSFCIYCKANNIEFIIRQHPRDYYNYFEVVSESVYIDKSTPSDFTRNVNVNDVIISSLSTLSFELMHLGASAIFISSSEMDKLYKNKYDMLKISPCYSLDGFDINNYKYRIINIFSQKK